MKLSATLVAMVLSGVAALNLFVFPLVIALFGGGESGWFLLLYIAPEYWTHFVIPAGALAVLALLALIKNRPGLAVILSALSLATPYILLFGTRWLHLLGIGS